MLSKGHGRGGASLSLTTREGMIGQSRSVGLEVETEEAVNSTTSQKVRMPETTKRGGEHPTGCNEGDVYLLR